MSAIATPPPPHPDHPAPIFNCPHCSHWIAEGTLSCPDCGALVYSEHIASLVSTAQALESERRWPEARAAWVATLSWLPADAPQFASQHTALIQRIQSIDAHSTAAQEKSARWAKRLGPLAPVLLLLSKLKGILFLLLKAKFLFSFLAFFGLYWAMFGWKFALGFTLSILVHEMGHFVAVKARGLKADLPVFLPGLGAYVRWYSMGIPLPALATIALAGPLFGLAAALVCLALYPVTHQPVFLALAHTGAFVNLLNLIPVLGLDGAQATYALNRLQRILLTAACVVLFALMHEGVFLFLAAGMAWRCFTRDLPEHPSTRTLAYYLLLLFALGAFLFIVPPGTVRGGAVL